MISKYGAQLNNTFNLELPTRAPPARMPCEWQIVNFKFNCQMLSNFACQKKSICEKHSLRPFTAVSSPRHTYVCTHIRAYVHICKFVQGQPGGVCSRLIGFDCAYKRCILGRHIGICACMHACVHLRTYVGICVRTNMHFGVSPSFCCSAPSRPWSNRGTRNASSAEAPARSHWWAPPSTSGTGVPIAVSTSSNCSRLAAPAAASP